jgi:hypothetical protein
MWDDKNPSLKDLSPFHTENGGHDGSYLVGVGPTEEEEGSPFLFSLHHVDRGIAGRSRKGWEVVAQPTQIRHSVAGADVVRGRSARDDEH